MSGTSTHIIVLLVLSAHALRSGFAAQDTAEHARVRVSGLAVGARVRRGPDWLYGAQDGARLDQPELPIGTVVQLRAWRGSNDTLGATVVWDAPGTSAYTYRWSMLTSRPRDLSVVGEIGLQSRQFEAAHAAFLEVSAAGEAGDGLKRGGHSGDTRALMDLYLACGHGRGWHASDGWSKSARGGALDPCGDGWAGVSCIGGRVVALDLPAGGLQCLQGLPRSLVSLTMLRSLNLERNHIPSGAALAQLCAMPALEHIALGACGLHGPVPACLASLPRLATLSLHGNDLSGPLPGALLLQAPGLRMLHLHGGNQRLVVRREDAEATAVPSLCVGGESLLGGAPSSCTRAHRRACRQCRSLPAGSGHAARITPRQW